MSKKGFSSPTYSSSQKTSPPINMRERIVRLNDAVNDLRSNVETEANHFDNLEKQYGLVDTQIKALRKAFNTLADVVMEELDSIKTEVFKDYANNNAEIHRRIDDIHVQIGRAENDREKQTVQAISNDQEMKERIRDLDRRIDDEVQYLKAQLDRSHAENKQQFEKLKALINTNSAQFDILTKDNEKVHNSINEIRTKTTSNTANLNDFARKFYELEESIKNQGHNFNNHLSDLKNEFLRLRENLNGELDGVLRNQTDFHRRSEENSLKLNEKLENNHHSSKQKIGELENIVSQIQLDFQENIQDLARIHKESSTQIILDFEKAINSINNDTKILHKKFSILENNQAKSREELASMVSEHEHLVSKKNEQFHKAVFDMCRQLNISNPLLSY